MILAEELALIAVDPETGRHTRGIRDQLNACLTGLLIAELILDGVVTAGDGQATVVLIGRDRPANDLLSAAADVVDEKGPKIKAVLSHMSRGLSQRLGAGTWDAVVGQLADRGVMRRIDRRVELVDASARHSIIDRLRAAADGDEALDVRTALVLSMTGPANLLELVAPDRASRRHVRRRIDHALDRGQLQPVGEAVRGVLAEAAATVAATTAVAATISAGR